MARLHPEDIDDLENAMAGERKVIRSFREAARPDSDFIGWYDPTIGEKGREPDFIVFGNQQGLLVRKSRIGRLIGSRRPIPTVIKFFSTACSLWSLDIPDGHVISLTVT
jgi:hypothetical protein